LKDAEALADAYARLESRLGSAAIVEPMAPRGIELSFGMTTDPQFGPVLMIGAGGTLVEILRDRICFLPPIGTATARRLIDRLAVRPLLGGFRAGRPADIDALATALSRFSMLVAALAGGLAEIDINPVIVSEKGCVAVDALVVSR